MLHELMTRENDGISVTLFWADYADVPVIGLTDTRTEFQAMFTVPRESARDAFDHPFAYETIYNGATVEAVA